MRRKKNRQRFSSPSSPYLPISSTNLLNESPHPLNESPQRISSPRACIRDSAGATLPAWESRRKHRRSPPPRAFARPPQATLAASVEHLPRHTDAFLGQEEGTALLLGVWVPCRSRWVIAAKYEAEAEELWIRFGKDGVVEAEGYYPGVGFATAESFASASSKGGWLHDEGFVKGRSFIKV
jgi:hypothetical protein